MGPPNERYERMEVEADLLCRFRGMFSYVQLCPAANDGDAELAKPGNSPFTANTRHVFGKRVLSQIPQMHRGAPTKNFGWPIHTARRNWSNSVLFFFDRALFSHTVDFQTSGLLGNLQPLVSQP
jgi:hypothetical protein